MATNVAAQGTTFLITDTKLYVPVVALSTEDNTKLVNQLKAGFKRTINWNKYQSEMSTERQNQYLDYLIDSKFQGVNRVFAFLFEKETQRISYKQLYLLTVEIKTYAMINGQNIFDQPVRNTLIIYDSIQTTATGQ